MAWLVNGKTFARKIKDRNYAAEKNLQCPSCGHDIDKREVMPEWPGLPAGVKFDPTDKEVLDHLAAQVGLGTNEPHPFINEFIPTLAEDDGICYTHPERLPGIRRDGSSTHFFHRPARAYTTGTRKRRKIQSLDNGGEIRWHKTGKTRAVSENNKRLGCKKIMVLYASSCKRTKPEKTNWVMHQYHLGLDDDEREGELVVSKVFYQIQPRQAVATRKDNVEEVEQVCFEQLEEEYNDLSGVMSVPITPSPSYSRGLLETLSEDVNRLKASIGTKQVIEPFSDPLHGKLPFVEADLEMALSQGLDKHGKADSTECRPLVIAQEETQRDHDDIAKLGSQQLLGSLDADLLKLLCNENIKALSQCDGNGDWKSIVADACSKLESQDGFSIDKIVLGTPPADFLEHLFNSQGSVADWTEKLKLWGDSQKTEDFSLADLLPSSQPLP